jgi:hypothetical protein
LSPLHHVARVLKAAGGDLAMDSEAFLLDACPTRFFGIGNDIDREAAHVEESQQGADVTWWLSSG